MSHKRMNIKNETSISKCANKTKKKILFNVPTAEKRKKKITENCVLQNFNCMCLMMISSMIL